MKIPAVMSGEPRSQIIAIEEFVTDLVFTHGSTLHTGKRMAPWPAIYSKQE